MKQLFTYTSIFLALFFSLGINAQTKKIEGTYHLHSLNDDLKLKLNNDGTFDLVLLSGKYEPDNKGNINFKADENPSFIVEQKEKGNSDALKINFKLTYLATDLRCIYVGYEENNQVKYINLYDVFPSGDFADLAKSEDSAFYQLKTIEIPKTENLYLVNAFAVCHSPLASRQSDKKVAIEKFPIGKLTSAVDVLALSSLIYNAKSEFQGKYKPEDEQIDIDDIYGSKENLVFKKTSKYDKKSIIAKSAVERVKNWEYLKSFDDLAPEDSSISAVETRIKLEIKDNLPEALKSAQKSDKPLLIFYQPENTDGARQDFEQLISQYESELQYYASYINQYDKFDFYLADKKDEKWLKKKSIKPKNQVFILDGNGDIIYSEENTIAEIQPEIHLSSSLLYAFEGMYTIKKIDDVVSNKNATASQICSAFLKAHQSQVPLYLFTNQEIINKDDIKIEDSKYYFEKLKNREHLYRLKATPDQIAKLWRKMITAHNKDTKLDPEYALLISKNYQSYAYESLMYKLFGEESKVDETDIQAATYLIKFQDDIKKHNDMLGDAYTYSEYIDFNLFNFSSLMNNIAEKEPKLRDNIKQAYYNIKQTTESLFEDFNIFMETYYPDEYLDLFSEYYNKMVSAEPSNIILSLDKIITKQPLQDSSYASWSWTEYKENFANKCNNAAWKVVENRQASAKLLQEALKWSKTSLELYAYNAHYLDTYAHLLYFTGDKQKAIETQRKAVQISEQNRTYIQEEGYDFKETLSKMEKGTL